MEHKKQGNMSKSLHKLKVKYTDTLSEYPFMMKPIGFIAATVAILSNRFNTFFYKRRFNMVGRYLSIEGKPMINNRGFIELGEEVRIWSKFMKVIISVKKGARLKIGHNTRINGVHIACKSNITIGNNVRIAPYVLIMDSDFHNVEDHFSEAQSSFVVIEDDVWIASKSTILKGVTVGKGSVIAAGSVVTKNVEPYTVVGGVPSKMIKSINKKV